MKKIILIITLSLTGVANSFGQQFEGYVVDSLTKQPIPFVNVYIIELQTGVTTNNLGTFSLPSKIKGRVRLQISCIGYQTIILAIDLSVEKSKTFLLPLSHLQLHEVIVSTPSFKLQQENIVSVVQKSLKELTQNAPTNLTEALSNIAGVDNYSTGSGIGKPVIRGLSGNRIVVYAQDVRLENQQWGDEHGLGIGEAGIENVEIIKGASSLLYGSDAMGGVVYFVDERYAPLNSFQCFGASRFQSNTLGTFNDAGIKFNNNSFRMNLFGNFSSNADYKLPDSHAALNTRFNESNFKTSAGYNYKNWIGNIRYSFLHSEYGITESDSISGTTDRDPLLPYQETDNHLLSLNNVFSFDKTSITATFGYNLNNRKEFEDIIDDPALNLVLQTYSYIVRSNSSFIDDKLNIIAGLQGMFQQNKNKAAEILIPDAHTTDIGSFLVVNYTPAQKLTMEGGIRYDRRRLNSIEMTTPDVSFPELDKRFSNLNFSIGSSYKFKFTVLRLNIASGFRSPNLSELLSNGPHEGTLRFEIGNKLLKSEQATQADFSINYENEHFSLYINPYYTVIRNYIFLSPTDSFNNTLPVFNYKQTTAYLSGGELGFHWHPHPIDWMHIESNFSSVYAGDRSGKPIPLIPQNKIQTTLRGEFNSKNKFIPESAFVEHIYRFKQDRTAIYESTTSEYHLFNAGINFNFNVNNSTFEITTGVKNILNTEYIDHLSRFKQIGINNAGLNAFFGLKWNFSKNQNYRNNIK